MKRLRKHCEKIGNPKIRFFHCGEYGDQYKRPHYHALVFGYDVPDRKVWKMSNDIPVYSSATLDSIWGHGATYVGDITWESAAYVARYTMKKVNGKKAQKIDEETGLKHYERICPYTLQIHEVDPEYATQSNGLGKTHYDKYRSDIYPWDEVIVNGYPQRPPRYYDKLFEQQEPEAMETIRRLRCSNMEKHLSDNIRRRLRTKETVKIAQTTRLKRNEEHIQ